MKKLLFITCGFGNKTPVGVGAVRIVTAFANQGFRVFVITSRKTNLIIPNVEIIVKQNTPRMPSRVSTKLSNLFGKELYYWVWEKKAFCEAKSILRKHPDIIAVYTRATPISVCPVGVKLKKAFHIPLFMHFTDPIPAPIEWFPDDKSRKRMIKQMQFLLPHSDSVSFGNQYMLQYEENILNMSLQNKAFVSPDPGFSRLTLLPPKKDNYNSINMLFLGNIYGNRNPLFLFEAIEKLLPYYPIRLYLYGSNNGSFPVFVISKSRTNDVFSVLQEADILVDIDGDDKTPVFVSSKLKDYLAVNRPILSITPYNSPSREILHGLSTVGIATNTSQDIKETMLKLIQTDYVDSDYEERIPVLKTFDPNLIVSDIIKHIETVTNNNQIP